LAFCKHILPAFARPHCPDLVTLLTHGSDNRQIVGIETPIVSGRAGVEKLPVPISRRTVSTLW